MGISPDSNHGTANLPTPPALAMPTELNPASTNNPSVPAGVPIRKLLSGVKLSGPLTNFGNFAVRSAGMRCFPAAQGSENLSQSSGSKPKAKSPGTVSPICQGFERHWKAPSLMDPSSSVRK